MTRVPSCSSSSARPPSSLSTLAAASSRASAVCRYGLAFHHTMTYRPKEGLRFLRTKPLGKNIQQPAKCGFVSLGEELLTLRGKLVDVSRLAAAASAPDRTSLAHDAVALQDAEMRADAVVGEIQCPGEVLHSALGASEQRDDPPSRALEEPHVPVRSQ